MQKILDDCSFYDIGGASLSDGEREDRSSDSRHKYFRIKHPPPGKSSRKGDVCVKFSHSDGQSGSGRHILTVKTQESAGNHGELRLYGKKERCDADMKKRSQLREWKTSGVYYAAANSADGFRSYFPEVFGNTGHLYILKGGPGTGKSRLMEEAAQAAERKGMAVERFRCSSDPDSLDGVLIPEKGIGILDGTAPHMTDPKYPGAEEEILNLGGFWDTEKLKSKRETIKARIDEKGGLYDSALRLLHLAGELRREQTALLRGAIREEKLNKAAARLLSAASPGKGKGKEKGKETLRLIEAIGMKGRVRFTSLEERAGTVCRVPCFFGGEGIFLAKLLQGAREKGAAFTYSLSPLLPEVPDAIFFPESETLVIAGGQAKEKEHLFNLRRFTLPETLREKRPLLRFLAKEEDAMLYGAEQLLDKVRTLHFSTEQIYSSAMDFEEKEKFTKEFLGYLF